MLDQCQSWTPFHRSCSTLFPMSPRFFSIVPPQWRTAARRLKESVQGHCSSHGRYKDHHLYSGHEGHERPTRFRLVGSFNPSEKYDGLIGTMTFPTEWEKKSKPPTRFKFPLSDDLRMPTSGLPALSISNATKKRNTNLIEFQRIQQVKEFFIFLFLFEPDIVPGLAHGERLESPSQPNRDCHRRMWENNGK